MEDIGRRPFYDEYAWAYDLLITPPIAQQCDFIVEKLSEYGVPPPSRVLDAGCGTGRYAVELASRGYVVSGVDASAQLIEVANKRADGLGLDVSFSIGNILDLTAAAEYDGILCRGVLNDFLDDAKRREVFFAFARALRPSGTLILDVREWAATAERKEQQPLFEKTVDTARGTLTFRSETRLDYHARQLLVSEQHALKNGEDEIVASHEFRMQCWTAGELEGFLGGTGFEHLELFGAYDVGVLLGSTDRIVSVSRRAG